MFSPFSKLSGPITLAEPGEPLQFPLLSPRHPGCEEQNCHAAANKTLRSCRGIHPRWARCCLTSPFGERV